MCVTPSPESTTTPVVRPVREHAHSDPDVRLRLDEAPTLRVKRQHGLNSHIYAFELILLKHDLNHPLSVGLWVHRRFCEQHFASARVNLEFLVKGVIPEMFHVVPVPDDTVFHRLGDLEVVAILCGFVADHDVFDLCGADALFNTQDRTADDGGKDCDVC